MTDPRARITAGLRGLSAPPPPRPATTQAARPDQPNLANESLRTGDAHERARSRTPRPTATQTRRQRRTTAPGFDELPGRPVGNKRALVAQLPATVREALDSEVALSRATKGIVIMRALREQYDRLTPQAERPSEPSGPFPPERPPTRRRAVPNRVPTTYTLWPDECDAIVHVADQLGVNLSELITDALALRYNLKLGAANT